MPLVDKIREHLGARFKHHGISIVATEQLGFDGKAGHPIEAVTIASTRTSFRLLKQDGTVQLEIMSPGTKNWVLLPREKQHLSIAELLTNVPSVPLTDQEMLELSWGDMLEVVENS